MSVVPFELICPGCRAPLVIADSAAVCAGCAARYPRQGGVWRMLAGGRAEHYAQFLREYGAVRAAEGRGSEDARYYRALPYLPAGAPHAADWRIRARSYEALLRHVVAPLERGAPLRALDLGAGCGWLAYQLARRGHHAAAVDLWADARDGLGAHVHYDEPIVPIQAEFGRLPVADGQLDLLVVNAALHYAASYPEALREMLRTLRPGGALAIVDTPVYRDGRSGAQMLRERGDAFARQHGFRGEALPSEGYLTFARLAELGRELGLAWRLRWPRHGLLWALRPLRARLRGRREPASFPLIVAERPGGAHGAG